MSVFDERRGGMCPEEPFQNLPPLPRFARQPGAPPAPGEGAPYQEIPWRGEAFDVSGAIIIQGATNTANQDTAGRAVATATGFTYTNALAAPINKNTNIDVATFDVPANSFALLDEVWLRADSEVGWQLVAWQLIFGGVANDASGGGYSRVVQTLTNPFDRDGPLTVRKIVKQGITIRLTANNNDTEAPHLVEGRIRGWIFPEDMLTSAIRNLLG